MNFQKGIMPRRLLERFVRRPHWLANDHSASLSFETLARREGAPCLLSG